MLAGATADLLRRINAQLPPAVDWKAGARSYFAQALAESPNPEWLRSYLYTKPFTELGPDGRARAEFIELLQNFINVFVRLDLRPPARVLDVACGSGWLSHNYLKLGFETLGIDISADAVAHAKARIAEDSNLPQRDLDSLFRVHDIEADPLDADDIDAAIFESCLHHFENPVSALEHVAAALNESGVIVLIEGENRQGALKDEYVKEMQLYGTIERPYARAELVEILYAAGLPHFAFFGTANGWYTAEAAAEVPAAVRATEAARNFTICAKTSQALQRVVPDPGHGLADFDLIEGFSRGSEPRCEWAAPFARFRTARAFSQLTLRIGSPFDNPVVVYSRNFRTEVAMAANRETAIDLADVPAGSEIMLSSQAVFVPAWTAGDDARPLSFWVRFP